MIRRCIRLRMRNVSDKIHALYVQHFFQKKQPSVYEIMWKQCDSARQVTNDNIKPSTHFASACPVTMTTNTYSDYVELNRNETAHGDAREWK